MRGVWGASPPRKTKRAKPAIVGGRGATKQARREATRGVAQAREKPADPPARRRYGISSCGRGVEGLLNTLTSKSRAGEKSMRILITIIASLMLTGCANIVRGYSASSYKPIDFSNKSIAVPPGEANLLGIIKTKFRKNGWKIVVADSRRTRTSGVAKQSVDLTTEPLKKASYGLLINQSEYDFCYLHPGVFVLDFLSLWLLAPFTEGGKEAFISYNISIYERKSGEEVFTSTGRGCITPLGERLNADLKPFWEK